MRVEDENGFENIKDQERLPLAVFVMRTTCPLPPYKYEQFGYVHKASCYSIMVTFSFILSNSLKKFE